MSVEFTLVRVSKPRV